MMGLYEIAKDAAKLAQKADNAELVKKLLDVQQLALEMQNQIGELEAENRNLKETKKLRYEEGHNWRVNEDRPDIKLCPVCASRDHFENPLTMYEGAGWCEICKKEFR